MNNDKPISPKAWELEEGPSPELMTIIKAGEILLENSTGHNDYNRRKIVYYAIATYSLHKFDFFPILVPYGPPSTGKTATLVILKGLCWRATSISGEAITEAALKASMVNANIGTLIIEEGDKISTQDFEGLLITRCYRPSAFIGKMVPVGKAWELAKDAAFGATIIHRRNLFKDPALLRRSIPVKTKREKKDYSPVPYGCEKALAGLQSKLKALPALPAVENIWDIEPGVFDCYKPVLSVAYYVDDHEFIDKLVEEMRSASKRLRDEETYLEAPCLLKAILVLVCEKLGREFTTDRINIEVRGLKQKLFDEFNSTSPVSQLSANQRNRIIRDDLGFEIRSSHGRQRIYLTIPQLIKRCEEYGVEDDVLAEWKSQIRDWHG
jgi:hypothetical protein